MMCLVTFVMLLTVTRALYSPLCHVTDMSLLNSGDRYRTGAEWAWGASQGEVTWAQKTYRYSNGNCGKNSI
jgi:hypothetical protein